MVSGGTRETHQYVDIFYEVHLVSVCVGAKRETMRLLACLVRRTFECGNAAVCMMVACFFLFFPSLSHSLPFQRGDRGDGVLPRPGLPQAVCIGL